MPTLFGRRKDEKEEKRATFEGEDATLLFRKKKFLCPGHFVVLAQDSERKKRRWMRESQGIGRKKAAFPPSSSLFPAYFSASPTEKSWQCGLFLTN